jgi:hypothetical protein
MADLLTKIDVILREGGIPVKRLARGKLGQLQRDAFKLINASVDIMPGTEPMYEYDKRQNTMWVTVTLYDGRTKSDMVFWDEKGAYLRSAGMKFRWGESGRRPQGSTYPDRSSERW